MRVVDENQWGDVICGHSDRKVRRVYRRVMSKVVAVYGSYFNYSLGCSSQHTSKSLANLRL